MAAKLYAVPASHPCAVAERALELKGLPFERIDLLPVAHKVQQKARFGGATVPGLVLDGGEKVLGSRAILRRLDELAPEPALVPAGGAPRTEVLLAEEWGDEVLQPIVRRLVWATLRRAPGSLGSYAEGANLPVPAGVAALGARPVAWAEVKINGAGDLNARADLVNLPHHLERVDGWIGRGAIGGPEVNAADLQIAASLRLLLTLGDVAPLIDARPAGALARRHFPAFPGHVAPGTLPADWLPAA